MDMAHGYWEVASNKSEKSSSDSFFLETMLEVTREQGRIHDHQTQLLGTARKEDGLPRPPEVSYRPPEASKGLIQASVRLPDRQTYGRTQSHIETLSRV